MSPPDSDDRNFGAAPAQNRPVRAAAKRPPTRWQRAEVLGIIAEAPDAATLRLGLEEPADFLPGQYYNVRMPVSGRLTSVQRAYSVASSPVPDSSIIDIGVREVPGGLISPLLVGTLAVGDRVEVRGPAGRFTWTADDGGPVLLIGAGSGVVPLMSIVRYVAAASLDIPIRLVCSSSSFEYALYHEDLGVLAQRHSWLGVIHTFTRAPGDPRAAHHRRIDRAMLADAVAQQHPERAYVCGPPEMVENVQEWLSELGVDPTRVRTEKYD